MPGKSEDHDVIIVGAGITGLVAARRLRAAGRRVTLLESGACPGGRLSTARGTTPPAYFDSGAPSFLAQDESFQREVATWQAAGAVAHWHPALRTITPYQATDADSDRGGDRIVGIPTMASLADYLARDVDIRYEITVEALAPEADGWSVRPVAPGDPGSSPALHAHEVLMTAPAPVSRDLLGAHAPDALSRVQMLPCWVVMAVLDRPLLPCDGAWVTGDRLIWVASESSKPGRPQTHAWTLLASPGYSSGHREARAQDVTEDLLAAARQLPDAADFLTHSTSAHLWRCSQTVPGQHVGVLRAPGLTVAGDWSYGGGVEAAWRAGVEAAAVLTA